MKISTPEEAFRFFNDRLRSEVEEFWAAALNADKRVIRALCLFRGTVDHCTFHPRDVFRFAYMNNASSLVVAHNHPSGNAKPSPQDDEVTRALLFAALLLEVPVVDHLILGRPGQRDYYSYLREGRLRSGSA
ncbi:MAG TPA: JAB domain-containing protein [Bdellovibrionales bacterium]|nr:JAB domain-containing protein [Bdellovibrionales bacterium]